jgi:citrate synthase
MTSDAPTLSPGLEGVPIATSSVSKVDGEAGRLTYRGYPIEDLALRATFEEIVALLYDGQLPNAARLSEIIAQLERDRALTDGQIEFARSAAKLSHPMFALQAATAILGPDVNDFEADIDVATDRGIALVAKVGHLVGVIAQSVAGRPYDGPRAGESHGTMMVRMITGEEPSAAHLRSMNAVLTLQADHSAGNASTFTARVVASTKSEPEAVISSAIGALSGPAHGGANEASLRLFQQIKDPAKAKDEIERLLNDRYKIPGFGHRVYHVKDPRSIVIQTLAGEVIEAGTEVGDLYQIALTVEQVATDRLGSRGLFPNVDLFSGCIFAAIGVPTDFFTPIFAAARTLGWAVHFQEQWDSGNRIFRPKQIYTGEPERDFIEIDNR